MLQVACTIFFKNECYEKKILGFMKFHGIEIIIEIIKKTKQNKTKTNGLSLNPCTLQIEVNVIVVVNFHLG